MNEKTTTQGARQYDDRAADERSDEIGQEAEELPEAASSGDEKGSGSPASESTGPRGGTSEAGEAGVSPSPEEVEKLTKLAAERDVYLDELRRSKAEFENYRKRVRRERPGWEAQAVRRLVQDLLPVIDNFERALDTDDHATVESFREGVAMIVELARKTLGEHEVREIDAGGARFDPRFHEAVAQIPVEEASADGRVVEVLEKGYLHGDTVVRPSRVVVGKATPAPQVDEDVLAEDDAQSQDDAESAGPSRG